MHHKKYGITSGIASKTILWLIFRSLNSLVMEIYLVLAKITNGISVAYLATKIPCVISDRIQFRNS